MSQIESFQTLPLQAVIPSYLYFEYSNDDNLQAFVASQNSLAQGYLNWFLNNSLGLYTSPFIAGPMLDWIGQGVYGISRPVLSTQTVQRIAGYNSSPYNTVPYNNLTVTTSGNATIASDDIYKRAMTWSLYRGDGQVFTMQWLKNRINRFLNGANGADYAVQNYPPSITVSGKTFTITAFASPALTALIELFANGALPIPFQYNFAFVSASFTNDGGVLALSEPLNFPSNSAHLPAGSIYYNGGTLGIVPGITPSPTAPAVYFNTLTPGQLQSLGGGNFPLTDPNNANQYWNNGGMIAISIG
ncbi:hypothetical protein [Dyella caseinilytica]|uniref:Uncharacterized protein n=1 Tax=Dyella caseinilytica TaxID=1849581 RepID=A0ABX7GXX5_9GAMM|nr:hypothetical protein [Dyella caseinilytica]QRN55262.1 hypothetical protein ISN74_08020 [Dyella caseinilytica]GGA00535.1 hypothetical protein GCM10011408_21830 [Dyella caseinilytica]